MVVRLSIGMILAAAVLDDDAAAVLAGYLEGLGHLLRAGQSDGDAAPVVGVVRLHHHGVSDPLGGRYGIVGCLHEPLLGNRQAEIAEYPVGLLLVGGQLDGYVGRAARDGGLNALLISSMAELNQTGVVQPDPGDLPLLRRSHQRHGAGAECPPLGEADELITLGGKIEPPRRSLPRAIERGGSLGSQLPGQK